MIFYKNCLGVSFIIFISGFVFLIGPSGVKIMTRRQFYNIMQRCDENDFKQKMDYAENCVLTYDNYSAEDKKNIKHKISHIKTEIKQRWIASHYNKKKFLKNNDTYSNNAIRSRSAN